MSAEANSPSSNNDAPKGLPPVAPPSGRFIAQLFLVPGMIVAVVVFIILGSNYLVRSSHTAASLLKDLDSENPEIRWRGAHEMAQVLKRPESLALASDPKFALDLAERLDRAVAEVERAEWASQADIEKADRELAKQGQKLTQGQKDAVWRKLGNPRNHVLYLTACLGDFTVPVGVPLLSELALKDTGAEVKGLTLRRRRAVWALANLGDNFKRRYLGEKPRPEDKALTPEQKEAIIEELKKEASGTGRRASWARQALALLENGGRPAPVVGRQGAGALVGIAAAGPLEAATLLPRESQGVDAVLERCARADDPFLRAQVALALNFWDGPRVEPALLRLARDDGHGTRIEATEAD
jgi:hypothetical protein